MEDRDIIALYFARAESAIAETAAKYGGYCRAIASRILKSPEDTEECLSDTWLNAWNAIPPQEPNCLRLFLGRITRNLALDRYTYRRAEKRNAEFDAVLEELSQCVGGGSAEADFDAALLGEAISRYLAACKREQRQVFLRRYWYGDSIQEIAASFHFTQSKVKSMLHRTRQGLREFLREEGFSL